MVVKVSDFALDNGEPAPLSELRLLPVSWRDGTGVANIFPSHESGGAALPGGWIEGYTAADGGWLGVWGGRFFGNGLTDTDVPDSYVEHPGSFAGTFGATDGNHSVAGSFGAHQGQQVGLMDVNPGSDTAADPSIAGSFVELPERQLALAVLGVILAIFLSVLSQTILATAMPRIIADLGGFDRYTWTSTAYLVTSAVAIPIAGRLSDIYGRRIFLILGLVIFAICSVLAGFSQSMNQLVASRALQGIGGGIITAACFAASADLFPPWKRGRFQALAGLAFGIAAVTGPLLGGFITDHFSWRWIFLLNVPVGVLVLLIILAFPKIRSEVEDRRLDYPGMAALALAVVSLMVGLSWGNGASALALGLVVFGVVMAVVFVAIESKSDFPIMPLEIYRDPTVAVSIIVILLTGFGLYGSVLFTPLFFQGALDASATSSGKVLAPMIIGLVLGAILSAQLITRTGGRYRAQAVLSTGMLAAGMYLLSSMNDDTTLARGMGYVFVAGLGVGGTLSTFRLAVQNSVPFRLVGTATSALQFYRLVSGTVGLAVLGTVLTRNLSSRLDATLSDSVKAALPPGRLDAIKNDPRALVDPVAAEALMAALHDLGPGGADLADALVGSLNTALAGAVGDVFTISAAVVVLSLIAATFLQVPAHARRAMQPRERMAPATRSLVLRNALTALCALVVLVLGAVGMKTLVGLREPPQRQVVEHPGPLVRVTTVQPQDVSITSQRLWHRAREARVERGAGGVRFGHPTVTQFARRDARQTGGPAV